MRELKIEGLACFGVTLDEIKRTPLCLSVNLDVGFVTIVSPLPSLFSFLSLCFETVRSGTKLWLTGRAGQPRLRNKSFCPCPKITSLLSSGIGSGSGCHRLPFCPSPSLNQFQIQPLRSSISAIHASERITPAIIPQACKDPFPLQQQLDNSVK